MGKAQTGLSWNVLEEQCVLASLVVSQHSALAGRC